MGNVEAPSLGSVGDVLLLLLRFQNLSRSGRSLGSRIEEIAGHLISSTILSCQYRMMGRPFERPTDFSSGAFFARG